ncbi:hypothetical protein evm_011930 [Chilo suppressalis]|nr:hypothetical protein evm_011930 [Chilo suppressalis]
MHNEGAEEPELSYSFSNVHAEYLNKNVDTVVNVVENGMLSPLLPGAEEISQELADIWEEVLQEDGGSKKIICDSSIRNVMSVQSVNDIYSNQPSTFSLAVPSSFENSSLIQLEELEVSHHRSTPVNLELSVSTPMPSPTNLHSTCDSVFCPNHVDSSVISSSLTNSRATSCFNNHTVTPKLTRKRQRRPKEWIDVKRKCLKNLGKKYVRKKGKAVDEKTMGPPCKCRYKCSGKVSHQQRLDCFTKFWQLGDRAKQWNFIIKYSDKMKKKRSLNQVTPNNRKFTFKYYLPLITGTSESHCEKIEICQIMFLNTLAITGVA